MKAGDFVVFKRKFRNKKTRGVYIIYAIRTLYAELTDISDNYPTFVTLAQIEPISEEEDLEIIVQAKLEGKI